MEGGYGYFMSNKMAKGITSSVLQGKYKDERMDNDYQQNQKSSNHASLGRSSV